MVDGYITCIILSAGESKRMGKPKLMLPLGKSTILGQTIDNFLNSKVNEVIVVVGDRADEIASLIANSPVKIAVNPVYRQGISTSIAAGLSLTGDKTRAVMLALADQPFIDTQTINHLIEAFSTHNKGMAIPVYQGRRGHPVIFAIKYKEELSGLKGDIGGRQIIDRHPDDILEVAVNCKGINLDIDTCDDYQQCITTKNEKTFQAYSVN
jgi:molybdenum cofactor cytidylyltransferase